MHARALFKFLAARSCWFVRVAWNRYGELELRCSREEKIRLGETLHGNHGWIFGMDLSWHETRFAEKCRSTCKYEKVRGLGPHETRVFSVRAEKNGGWRCLSPTVNVNLHYRGIKFLPLGQCFSIVLEFEQEYSR